MSAGPNYWEPRKIDLKSPFDDPASPKYRYTPRAKRQCSGKRVGRNSGCPCGKNATQEVLGEWYCIAHWKMLHGIPVDGRRWEHLVK